MVRQMIRAQALQVQGDSNPVGCAAAEIAVQLRRNIPFSSWFVVVSLIDAIHIVSMLSIIRTRTTGGCHGSRTEDAGARGVLQEDRRRKPLGAVVSDGRPDHAGAGKGLAPPSAELGRS